MSTHAVVRALVALALCSSAVACRSEEAENRALLDRAAGLHEPAAAGVLDVPGVFRIATYGPVTRRDEATPSGEQTTLSSTTFRSAGASYGVQWIHWRTEGMGDDFVARDLDRETEDLLARLPGLVLDPPRDIVLPHIRGRELRGRHGDSLRISRRLVVSFDPLTPGEVIVDLYAEGLPSHEPTFRTWLDTFELASPTPVAPFVWASLALTPIELAPGVTVPLPAAPSPLEVAESETKRAVWQLVQGRFTWLVAHFRHASFTSDVASEKIATMVANYVANVRGDKADVVRGTRDRGATAETGFELTGIYGTRSYGRAFGFMREGHALVVAVTAPVPVSADELARVRDGLKLP